jgi:hypothetical protein
MGRTRSSRSELPRRKTRRRPRREDTGLLPHELVTLLQVALTGGIATSKSFILARFASHKVPTIDADRIAHDVVRAGQPPAADIRQRFGDDVFRPDGELDREGLGTRVFDNPEERKALKVIMQIEIDNNFADFGRAINSVPTIVTQRAATTVQVANGDTTVTGGIFESKRTSSNNCVPGLHRIPLLGWLFRSQPERESTEELLTFLTPKIVR